MREINLLQRRNQQLFSKTFKLVRSIAIGLLFLVAFSSASLFFINSRSPLANLQQEEVQVLSNLSLSQGKIAKLIILDDRLRNVLTLSENRSNFDKTMDLILTQAPGDVKITNIKLDKEKISLSALGTSVDGIDTFINNMANLSNKEKYQMVVLKGISLDPKTGKYSLSIDINLK